MIDRLVEKFWQLTEWPAREVFNRSTGDARRIFLLTRVFYCALLFFACEGFLDAWKQYPALDMDPLWPLFWMRGVGQYSAIIFVLLLSLISSLAAAWKPSWTGLRVLAFLGCLETMALDNSFGKINNHLHLWTFAAFMLIFLPREEDTKNSTEARKDAERIFWGVQAFILLTYTMSGLAKLLGALVQLHRHDAHTLFSSDALARHIAERLMQTSETSLLGPWIIAHPLFGWPIFLGAVYLETFALFAAFRPSLLRPWALGLVLMHIGILLTMNVGFSNSILLLALFFFASPFSKQEFSMKQRIRDLPLFGPFVLAAWDMFFRSTESTVQTVVFYDGVCGICNRWVAFLLSRKLPTDMRFATLQGEHYRELKNRYPVLETVDTLVMYRRENGREFIRIRSEGVFWLLPQLPGWTRWTLFTNMVPLFVLDLGYRFVARIRHHLGKDVKCPVIPEAYRNYFLEDPNINSPSLSEMP